MTCRMAAGQQKKRFTNSNIPDQHRSKKKPKFDSYDSLVNLKSHIELKWDDLLKKVIPRREQIGISWSHLAPFIEPPRKCPSRLADVTCVPGEIFVLENLSGVLSYEVWAVCLTEADKKVLTQFLPTGTSEEEAVHMLLTGQNHHFGNPFLSWSSSFCHGNLHPDAVLDKQQEIRTDKRTYHEDIHNYHSKMIEILKQWKEKWLTCDSPESLFRHNLATKHKQGVLQSPDEKISSKASIKEMPMKGARNGDVSKFISYIQISRSQHDLVKRMKQSGDGIQTKHLTRVIGDIDNFHVKPYESFVEDEKNRLRNYWSILSRKDLPTAFVARRDRKSLIVNLRKSLYLDLAQKNISIVEKMAKQVKDRAEDVGQDDVYQNDDISDEQDELVDHLPQDVMQIENDRTTVHEDEDVEDTSDTDASICSRDSEDKKMKHQFAPMTTNHSQNSSDERYQDLKDISGTNSGRDRCHSSGEPGKDLDDIGYRNGIFQTHSCPCVEDEDTKDTGCIHTSLQDHNSRDMGAQELKGVNHGIVPIQGLNSSNMLVQGLKNTSYSSLPIRSHGTPCEQDDAFRNISFLSASTGHDMNNIPSANSNPQINHMIVDQKEARSISMIPSHSTLLFSKPWSEKGHVEGLERTVPCEKDLWQPSNPMDAFYHPPVNSLSAQSGGLQLKHNFSGGQAATMDMGGDVRSQQQAKVTISAAQPMSNAASLLQRCTNPNSNLQLQSEVKGIEMVPSYSHGHINGVRQSVDLHPLINNRLPQSALVRDPLAAQMQLLDQRHNGLYLQQLQKNLYSGAGLSTQETLQMVERQDLGTNTPTDQSCNWFPNKEILHNNWSAIESDGIEAQDLPSRSSADGNLSSVLSQHKQSSSHMQWGASSSNQSLETKSTVHPVQNVVDNTAPPAPSIYGYTQNLPRNSSSHVASADASLNNLQWQTWC